ncbi:demethoxyubiquinone hydroxylase family protein [Aestuariispira insulae]|uniref:3-demethoxyubiquinol 3-hydroxylase n=1 Tax=Aestuariispira insulae TaxID=1461337 RepID=A0A3D9HPQ0_9PROT|nr:demethoxyubiquinone hydroxylase family protein [Aestuariispira insulae]RED51291.1 ubiquinone biosynthesis monooxygenase Coq7 [Aestuariispira insulae]
MSSHPRKGPSHLPGDPRPNRQLERAIRVNHAGEYGAKRIYAGQIAVLGNEECGDTLRHMAEQEQVHLDAFSKELNERRIRPSALSPLWHVMGYALGAGTAMISEKAAMACTVAVEEVIDEHYAQQRDWLAGEGKEPELVEMIERFRQEEVEHRDIGYENGAEDAPAYPLLTGAIKKGSKLAIWLAERV